MKQLDVIKREDYILFKSSIDNSPNKVSKYVFNNVIKWCQNTGNMHLPISKAIETYSNYMESLIP